MMTTAPAPELLLDHRGTPRRVNKTSLSYDDSRLGTAFHEAGHAVVAMSYGLHVVTSEIIAWSPEPGQWRTTGNTALEFRPSMPWQFATQSAASTLAEVRYLMVYGLWTPGVALGCAAEHDREQAIDVLAANGHRIGRDRVPAGGKSWGQVRGIALRKVDRLWPEIQIVAHAMNENTKLTGDQIAAMTGLTNFPLGGAA
ncbi:hypothetical protein [Streptomyces sp. NPDC092952]|uniref:hypothetical protein n=1 Tax=Streptomyces sp. NPDC092952 TaxID=3366018 RepID=UPI003823B924